MTRRLSVATRAAAVVAVAGAFVVAGAGSGQAADDPVGDLVGQVGSVLTVPTGAVPTDLPTGGLPTGIPTGLPTGLPGTSGTQTPGSTATAPANQPKANASSAPKGSSASAPRQGAAPTSAPGATAAGSSPIGSFCIIPKTGSPAFEVAGDLLGQDLAGPLIEQFPQAAQPCPADAIPVGDYLGAINVNVDGLLGACVRITKEVAPLQTSLVVLDTELIKTLTDAGLPLQQLVVPCPAGAAPAAPGAGSPQQPGSAGPVSAASSVRANSAAPRLAYTGADILPMTAAGLALLVLGGMSMRASSVVARVTGGQRRH
jgi:hypothetical protein